MTVSKSYTSYNGRRFGRPWAAKITAFNGAATLDFIAGAYNGNDNGGELIISGNIGEVIKAGQKDHRSNKSDNDFYLITESGLKHISDPVEARQLWIKWQAAKNNTEVK